MDKEGKRLAEVVRRTHKHLRKQYKLGEDAAQVWKQHTQHEEDLQTYANAMHTLATQHWEARQQVNTSRVIWIHSAIMEYFQGGEMQRTTEKEMRKIEHLDLKADDSDLANGCKLPLTSKVRLLDVGSCYNPFLVYDEFDVTAIDLCPAHLSVKRCDFLSLEVCTEVRKEEDIKNSRGSDKCQTTNISPTNILLETNSSSNISRNLKHNGNTELVTSSVWDEKLNAVIVQDKCNSEIFETVGGTNLTEISLQKTCLQNIENESIVENTSSSGTNLENTQDSENKSLVENTSNSRRIFNTEVRESGASINEVTYLQGSSFDVVVFSLLLEYIPSPMHRFLCCQKAYNLLKPNGILCIITPDSKHQNANVHLYKLWKISLGYLGFARIKYEKHTHFHGMVFRRGLCKQAWQLDATRQLSFMKKINIKKKFAGIDYNKISNEMYIPQDFQDLSDSEEVPNYGGKSD